MSESKDIRHGTRFGYREEGCRCADCRKAIAKTANLYLLRRAANGGPLSIDKVGAMRRIRALMVMGWPRRELAIQAGYEGDAFALILNGRRTRLNIDTHERICALYDRLSMTPGPSEASRMRNAKKGWAPPLAWDEESIDDPEAHPQGHGNADEFYRSRTEIDPVVIERILGGEGDLRATPAEKREVLRLWPGSHNELARLTGWNVHRYLDRSVGDAGDAADPQAEVGAA